MKYVLDSSFLVWLFLGSDSNHKKAIEILKNKKVLTFIKNTL